MEQPSKKRALVIDNLVDGGEAAVHDESDLPENDLTMLMRQVESTPKNSTIIGNESRSPDSTSTGGETDPETSGNSSDEYSSDEYDAISFAEKERSEDDEYPMTQKKLRRVISSESKTESDTESDESKAIKFVVDTVSTGRIENNLCYIQIISNLMIFSLFSLSLLLCKSLPLETCDKRNNL